MWFSESYLPFKLASVGREYSGDKGKSVSHVSALRRPGQGCLTPDPGQVLITCSMPGLSGLSSGLVSTCSGTRRQPTRGMSSQCLRAASATCSSVGFL